LLGGVLENLETPAQDINPLCPVELERFGDRKSDTYGVTLKKLMGDSL
jgi:hypothetical protein